MPKDRFYFVITTLPLWLSQAKFGRNTVWDERASDWLRKASLEDHMREWKKKRKPWRMMGKLVLAGFPPAWSFRGDLEYHNGWLWKITPDSPCLWKKAVLDEGFCSLENKQWLTCPFLGSKSISASQECCNKMSQIYYLTVLEAQCLQSESL